MYMLYSALLVIWGVLLLPAFLYKAWRRDKAFSGVSERLGRLPESLRSGGCSTIWFHACSVGETLSLQPLVRDLQERLPESRFVFSTITQTGRAIAVERFCRYGAGNTFYFPVDLACIVRRVLGHLQPSMVVIVDTEIWPNLLHQAHRCNIPVVLVNGRVSDASFPRYRRGRFFLKKVLPLYRSLLMQSEQDAARIAAMGAPPDKISVTGNMKFDGESIEEDPGAVSDNELEQSLGLTDNTSPLIVAGSTHQNEEEILFKVLMSIREIPGLHRTRLLVAPRHPERFDAVSRLATQNNLSVKRRSDSKAGNTNAGILLLDTLGELAFVYRYATIVFVGGTLVRHGGHSILEPALCARPIVVGPSMENFRTTLSEFLSHKGIRQIEAGEEDREGQVRQLKEVFLELLQNPAERDSMGRAARDVLDRNRGAVRRTVKIITSICEKSG